MSDTRRLFFALWPTAGLRSRLAGYAHELVAGRQCRLVPPGNLHVTLAFIGTVPASETATLIRIGRGLALTACELVFDGWAIWRQAGVLVLTASSVPQQLQTLAAALHDQATAAGFKLDSRPYRPHVTLARKVPGPAGAEKSAVIAPLAWPVRDFVLVESLSTAAGVQYKVLATFPS